MFDHVLLKQCTVCRQTLYVPCFTKKNLDTRCACDKKQEILLQKFISKYKKLLASEYKTENIAEQLCYLTALIGQGQGAYLEGENKLAFSFLVKAAALIQNMILEHQQFDKFLSENVIK